MLSQKIVEMKKNSCPQLKMLWPTGEKHMFFNVNSDSVFFHTKTGNSFHSVPQCDNYQSRSITYYLSESSAITHISPCPKL